MTIKIEYEGTYINGAWVTVDVDATDDQGQSIAITRDTDGTYCFESNFLGDGSASFASGLCFDECWLALATHFDLRPEECGTTRADNPLVARLQFELME